MHARVTLCYSFLFSLPSQRRLWAWRLLPGRGCLCWGPSWRGSLLPEASKLPVISVLMQRSARNHGNPSYCVLLAERQAGAPCGLTGCHCSLLPSPALPLQHRQHPPSAVPYSRHPQGPQPAPHPPATAALQGRRLRPQTSLSGCKRRPFDSRCEHGKFDFLYYISIL